MITIAVLGASGYSGSECVRLLQHHQHINIKHLFADRCAGQSTRSFFGIHNDLPDQFEKFEPKTDYHIDCLIIALPHKTVHKIMADIARKSYKVIDLSADFRLKSVDLYHKTYDDTHQCPSLLAETVYGIAEYNKNKIKQASLVANPGCYAISSILALKPLANESLIHDVIIDAKSGVSGAGKCIEEPFIYCEINEHTRAYKTNDHRHMAEINQECDTDIIFSPHLIPMNRGILTSCYISLSKEMTQDDTYALYSQFYKEEPFVTIQTSEDQPTTQAVLGTNMCLISIKRLTETKWVVFSAIDNLIKGSAGNAIQLINIMFDLPEKAGLPTIPQRI